PPAVGATLEVVVAVALVEVEAGVATVTIVTEGAGAEAVDTETVKLVEETVRALKNVAAVHAH
ncbi:hypothetical protein SARC_16724, partial [Sphaeroforma arctica JP610]